MPVSEPRGRFKSSLRVFREPAHAAQKVGESKNAFDIDAVRETRCLAFCLVVFASEPGSEDGLSVGSANPARDSGALAPLQTFGEQATLFAAIAARARDECGARNARGSHHLIQIGHQWPRGIE